MNLNLQSKIFGSRQRSRVLILIALLGETYPAELARLLGAPLYSVQKIVNSLESDRLIATRLRGNQRRVSLQPEAPGAKHLKEYLLSLARSDPAFAGMLRAVRTRPRRQGKPVAPHDESARNAIDRLRRNDA